MIARRLLVGMAALALIGAGCGDDAQPAIDDDERSGGIDEDGLPDGPSAATVSVVDASLGGVLVDGDGMTLYLFTEDPEGTSTCSGPCAQTWPPLEVDGAPVAGAGVDAAELDTILREDGATQVIYRGRPLYRYGPDQAPGDVSGHGVGDVWFAVGPDGEPITGGVTGGITGPGY